MRISSVLTLMAALTLAGCGTTPPHHGRWHPNGGPPRDENWHSPNVSLMRYDTNHDGILTRTELMAGLKAEFDTYDHDHNNCLSPDEVRAINQMRVLQDASQATPLVDWNQDGCIDFHEYSGTALSLFESLDVNGDGQLMPKELAPAGQRPGGAKPESGESNGRHGHEHGHGGGEGGGQGD